MRSGAAKSGLNTAEDTAFLLVRAPDLGGILGAQHGNDLPKRIPAETSLLTVRGQSTTISEQCSVPSTCAFAAAPSFRRTPFGGRRSTAPRALAASSGRGRATDWRAGRCGKTLAARPGCPPVRAAPWPGLPARSLAA